MNTDPRKALWLDRLNSSWIDGDVLTNHLQDKTADLVNNELEVCFELKQDQTYSPPIPGTGQVNNLDTLSNRLKGYAQSANKNSETILILKQY